MTGARAAESELVVLGRVSAPYGVRGWIRIQPFGAVRDSALLSASHAWLRRAESPNLPPPDDRWRQWRRVRVLDVRTQGAAIVARLEGCEDRDDALAFKGLELALPRSSFPPAEPDEYYWVDLIDCEIVDMAGRRLGRVVEVEDFGAPHPLLRVQSDAPETPSILIPFVAPIIARVDLGERRIEADWASDY